MLLAAVAGRPWNDFSATIEITPARATAPAIIHRLSLEIRRNPVSRALAAVGFIRLR